MGSLGLKEAVAMALGGMIGGGIYSAFGIVVAISGSVAWLAFLLAGTVAMCAGYSYVKLNELADDTGGAPTFIRAFVGSDTLAGMTGWTLLFGYIGSMALYAYAFSSFFSEMVGRLHVLGFPLASVVSVVLIGLFVGLNLLGAAETGKAEDVLTFFKIVVIGVFGVWGVWYAANGHTISLGLGELASLGPVMGAAMSFVAFQGWQLLLYDQGQFEKPVENIRKAIYVSIPAATLLYMLVAWTTVSLLDLSVIAVAPETSLLYAGIEFMGRFGAFVIGLSALFSTASAVNATLFSGAQFSSGLVGMGLVPDQFGGTDGEVPKTIVVVLGVLSAAFAVYGSLRSITSFASLAFIAVFGGISYLAFDRRRDIEGLVTPLPLVGLVGTALFFPLLLYDLYVTSPGTFFLVCLISVLVVGSELLYFEREPVAETLPWMGNE
ncbi:MULTISPECIES: APC family permease [Haloferax]|uniref:Inner membrane transport protein YbaT n=1 Tax=Haloferax massiliensis TaxID=1476858 RepID=A0A0D6JMH2_9EURY|nr:MULTISPECIES: APC family permease [Haloferax]MDS0242917.1 APC family permease [Haloferax sp. S2CR25]MDS0446038.1 APC family permease [Haloferax sp. S2CR25-2]CQR48803.1 Inner membrane transport protein YbaT [Haloferax massiliensis]